MGTIITGRANPQIKNIMRLVKKADERRRQGIFLVEGIRMFEETPQGQITEVWVSESFLNREENRNRLAGSEYHAVSDAVFKQLSDTQTPQGILCMVRMPRYRLSDLMGQGQPHLLLLETIQDPGNLGAMFRTAEGAGVTGIIMNRTCVDVFSPKTIRSTMGSIFRMPFYIADHLEETVCELKQRKITVYAAHLNADKYYDTFDYRQGCAFLIGNEGAGLSEKTAALADGYLRIPMEGRLESLNAAMAAGILMYEVNRQRRQPVPHR